MPSGNHSAIWGWVGIAEVEYQVCKNMTRPHSTAVRQGVCRGQCSARVNIITGLLQTGCSSIQSALAPHLLLRVLHRVAAVDHVAADLHACEGQRRRFTVSSKCYCELSSISQQVQCYVLLWDEHATRHTRPAQVTCTPK